MSKSIGQHARSNRRRVVQSSEPGPEGVREMEWVSQHREALRAYRGQWIAVKEDRLVAHSQDLRELMRALEAQGVALPFLTQLPSDDRRYLILAV